MAVFFEGNEIPGSLVKTIISTSLSKIGVYHGVTHKFHAPKFSPKFEQLTTEAAVFGYSKEETNEIVKTVLMNIDTEAVITRLGQTPLDLVGEKEIPLLTHIRFVEKNNSLTEMIYLGEQRFYVLATNRSTLMPGNLVKARDYPLNWGAEWNFDIYENFDSKKPSVPEGYNEEYQAWFQTTPITSIEVCSSPEILNIIDDSETWGGPRTNLVADADTALASMIYRIEGVVKDLPSLLPSNEQFPQYLELLEEAKSIGISTYILHTLIETFERRTKQEYVSTEKDWHVFKTEVVKAREKKEQEKRDREQYNRLIGRLDDELKQIKARRVFLFFLAPGIITEAGKNHLADIGPKLDALAEKGFGTKGYAEARIAEAKNKSKPPKQYNLIVSLILIAILFISGFVTYSWLTAKKSMAAFNQQLETVNEMVENEAFNDAKDVLLASQKAFKPTYLRFLVTRKTNVAQVYIEQQIDNFVENRIGQIRTLIRANRNRIDDYTWGLIVEAMEYRPDHEGLNELRQQYIAQ